MLVGYNTNVPYKGKLYHVQTEDSGLKNPVITTLLYFKGTILASRKSSYAHLAGDPSHKEKVRELMKDQHKAMIRELIRGKHTGEKPPEEDEGRSAEESAARDGKEITLTKGQISKSLDDILLDYIIRRKD
ncbi:MAG: hypothetical protein P8013_03340 [Candidatus Sulfobium sp.]|jgi:rRNA maturation endonuclease Nob1